MSLLLSILLLISGAAEPSEVAEHLETLAFEQLADPVERWRPLVAEHFPVDEVDRAMCIIRHESAGNPEADNPRSSATGLFQVLHSLWGPHYNVTRTDLEDPVTNVRIAEDLWQEFGWGAWSPYQRGACH